MIVVCVVAVGVGIAWRYVGEHDVPRIAPQDVSFVTRAARDDLYGDAFNEAVVMRPGAALVRTLAGLRRPRHRRAVKGGALGVTGAGHGLRRLQTGFVRSYALSMLAGALVVVVALLAVNAT